MSIRGPVLKLVMKDVSLVSLWKEYNVYMNDKIGVYYFTC